MARFAGVDIPNNKRVVISLTYIYGIGPSTASKILKECGISEDIRTKDLTTEQENAIRQQIDTIKTEGDLRRERVRQNALFRERPDDLVAALVQAAQVFQPVGELAQNLIVQRARRLLAVAGNEGYRVAGVQQLDHGPDLLRPQREFLRQY